ncbi:Hypothetical predicted protein [Octopus vulgaris]|uniref:Uncharacterized protein n=2 Tax=Octopus TaxID=6643 RepID=A0AA36B6H4_OCTVU|nr:uncharacterized protein LOC115215373 [Octopus sinensis]CAI9728785.1 Hypothetical predicted protein [Octopus vulgaris]
MKLFVFLICSMCSMVLFHHVDATSYQFDIRQSLATIDLLLKAGLSTLKVHVSSLFQSTSGKIPIDGTPLIMNYFAHDCDIHIGRKRMLLDKIISCEAEVTEAVTKTSNTCVASSQTEAVQCAVKKILEKIKSDAEKDKNSTY